MHGKQPTSGLEPLPFKWHNYLKKDPASFMWEVINFLLRSIYTTKKKNNLLLLSLKLMKTWPFKKKKKNCFKHPNSISWLSVDLGVQVQSCPACVFTEEVLFPTASVRG